MHSHEDFLKTRFFGSLDGLRFVSIAAVVWHHTGSRAFTLPLLKQGYHGVTFFFAISGFLITTLLLREHERHGQISLRKFYIRRSLRIFPLYYAVLLLYCVVVKLVEGDSSTGQQFFSNLKFYLTYTSNWFVQLDADRVIFYFAWSLATEEQFYLVWPSVQSWIKGRGPIWVALVTVLVSQLAAFGVFSAAPALLVRILASFSTAICLGVVLAHLLHRRQSYQVLDRAFGRRWSLPLFAALSILALGWGERLGLANRPLVELLLVAIVASCVIREDHLLSKALRWKPVAWVGTVSYGVYLLHMLSANAVKKLLPGITHGTSQRASLAYFLATLAVGVAAATVSFRTYESFFLRLKKRFET